MRFVNLTPSLIISVLNFTLPTLTKMMVAFEQWDFPEQNIKNEIWRNYIQKFINLTVFTLLSYEGLYDIHFFDDFLGTSFTDSLISEENE